jgi:aconitate hydratase
VIVGDENYGEGSSREHAAMSPRYLGCASVIARSFARIHESNLKKQGILPLTFLHAEDYEKIREGDRISMEYLSEIDGGRSVNLLLEHADGTSEVIVACHNMTMEHLSWFHAGSALNLIRMQQGKMSDAEGVRAEVGEAAEMEESPTAAI